ncbi:DRTGG domain-containing protein [Staphylococcus saccharolyticus]|uniref:CBS domain-containing protein n=2 Tax=Bacilli TaxID=91061 RepID=A0A380H261_9STAP|nr:DRTGG domain-containing protein [Staphylococcus saccharolyticus]MBL7565053.1 CBS domain-containing protein [Staphylococcus saccharolyticus]MBL7571910.1 CBS domain-containing protein [Staphylococcus saccharolyticus]QQB98395.1 CBS domain-containing protein [Staphylococcus saccharolyticus]QRJ67390.1 CBS domain-containing protein [Staphylococcus saccharolyticus]RTX97839.1 CBS domain-containing protein [Staphylococcus saccharolyticus]
MTKHEQIIKYIETLSIGSKISVRKIAKVLDVSEGTAYRAIKDAGQLGIVTTIDRVGTVRIEKRNRDNIDNLTFNEIAKIIDGQILGGKGGLGNTVSKFAIGAMELKDILKYIGSQTLLIVGNRENVQMEALRRGTSILITGGFHPSKDVINYANEHDLPILSSSYDTFLVANIINRAMYNQKIRKEILVVDDIVKPIDDLSVLFDSMKINDYKKLANKTGHTRFPIVNEEFKLVGIVTSREIINMNEDDQLGKVMTKQPLSVKLTNTVASCAHLMIWEGIELLPVTDNNKKTVGVINRQDVLKSMQLLGRQPQIGETISDQIAKHITIHSNGIDVEVSPIVTNHYGTLSKAVFVGIIEETIRHEMRKYKKGNVMIENLSITYIKTVPIESMIEVHYEMLDVGRYFAKLEVSMLNNNEKVANALIICQMFEGF